MCLPVFGFFFTFFCRNVGYAVVLLIGASLYAVTSLRPLIHLARQRRNYEQEENARRLLLMIRMTQSFGACLLLLVVVYVAIFPGYEVPSTHIAIFSAFDSLYLIAQVGMLGLIHTASKRKRNSLRRVAAGLFLCVSLVVVAFSHVCLWSDQEGTSAIAGGSSESMGLMPPADINSNGERTRHNHNHNHNAAGGANRANARRPTTEELIARLTGKTDVHAHARTHAHAHAHTHDGVQSPAVVSPARSEVSPHLVRVGSSGVDEKLMAAPVGLRVLTQQHTLSDSSASSADDKNKRNTNTNTNTGSREPIKVTVHVEALATPTTVNTRSIAEVAVGTQQSPPAAQQRTQTQALTVRPQLPTLAEAPSKAEQRDKSSAMALISVSAQTPAPDPISPASPG